MKHTTQLLLLGAFAGAVFAGDINVCSTGFDTATVSGCGPAINSIAANNLTADGNWYQASNTSGTMMGQAYVTVNNAFPVQNSGPWLANNSNDINGVGAGSSWIVPSQSQSNQGMSYINGPYYFATQFNLNASQVATASINGYWLADDYGGGIYLNGANVGQSSMPAYGGLGGPMVPFNIAQGVGGATYQMGTNVLTFGVTNDNTNLPGGGGDPSPTGVRVLFTNASSVPEPGTLFLMGTGLIGAGLLARRRRAKA